MAHHLAAASAAVLLAAGLTAPAVAGAAAEPTSYPTRTALTNGTYQVTIKHPLANAQPGWISVDAEGARVFDRIDFQWDKTFEVDVTDGALDLDLRGTTDLTGYRLYPVRIGAADPDPERTAYPWSQPVQNGTYQVTIKHPPTNPTPGRVSVDAEGARVLDDIDFQWDKTFDVVVKDGRLDLVVSSTTDVSGYSVHPVLTAPAEQPSPSPTSPSPTSPSPTPTSSPTTPSTKLPLGPSRSGLPWLSGVRPPGTQGMASVREFEAFRGSPLDAVLTYGRQDSYQALATETWPVTGFNGFEGRLVYSLPLIPWDRSNTLENIARGDQDWVWQAVAEQLRDNNRGDTIIRVGWEFNIPEAPWFTQAHQADAWKGAFRRVVTQMRPIIPNAKFEFGFNCGNGMTGSNDRLAPLTLGYPGDDVVDLVGCDGYDWWQTGAANEAEFQQALRPRWSTGFGDVADFARAHGKLISFGEWGLTSDVEHGHGDNPFYLRRMHQWFTENADILAVECYFDDPQSLGNSLAWGQLPNAAATYRELW